LAFSYWIDKPWFLTEGKLLLCSSYLPLGIPNWSVIYINTVRINEPPGARECQPRRESGASREECVVLVEVPEVAVSIWAERGEKGGGSRWVGASDK
jgi:hypothetical protein